MSAVRQFALAALLVIGAAARAAPPDPVRFAADMDAGKLDLAAYDFAATGMWDLPQPDRWQWYADVSDRLNLADPRESAGCAMEAQRRRTAIYWTMPLTQTLNSSAQDWRLVVQALRARLASVDSAIAAAVDAVVAEPGGKPVLIELQQRFARDQAVRALLDQPAPAGFPPGAAAVWGGLLDSRLAAIDCDNTKWLKAQLEKLIWFDIPTYGGAADEAAWHLVQHADREPQFQRDMLDILQSLPKDHTSQLRIAYLWDRVAGAERRPQRFGTQGSCHPDGSWKPFPVEDPEILDARRVAAGMKPIGEHAAEHAIVACPQPATK